MKLSDPIIAAATESFLFVYRKDGEVKALTLETAKIEQAGLFASGWKHTDTLNGCVYVERMERGAQARFDDAVAYWDKTHTKKLFTPDENALRIAAGLKQSQP